MSLVGLSVGVLRRSEPDLVLAAVVDGVEALEERVAVDEVEALAGRGADVGDDEVDGVVRAADGAVQGTRPDLGVGGELPGVLREGQRVVRGCIGRESVRRRS